MTNQIKSITPYNRPPREQIPFHPIELEIPAPSAKKEDSARNLLLSLLPVSGMLVMAIMYGFIYSLRGAGTGASGWLFALPMVFMGIMTVGTTLVMQGEQRHQQKINEIQQQRDYHRLLDRKESRLLAARQLETHALSTHYPELDETIHKVQTLEISLWERRREDSDFLGLRIGLGEIPSSMVIKPPDPDLVPNDLRRPFNIFTNYRNLPKAAVVIPLLQTGSLGIVGKRRDSLQVVNALLAQLAAYHSPEDVALYVIGSENSYNELQWLRWLPHCSDQHIGGKPTRLAFKSTAKRQQLMNDLAKSLDPSDQPEGNAQESSVYRVILFDRDANFLEEPILNQLLTRGAELKTILIVLSDILENLPSDCKSVIQIEANKQFAFWKTGPSSNRIQGIAETLDFIHADNLSHKLIPIATRSIGSDSRIPSRINLLQTYDVSGLDEFEIPKRWNQIPNKDGLLPFPILVGNNTRDHPLSIHLAENKDGPHGLVAGTTGSGKSELLQTLVSSLALEHHPYFLNFLLVDFKGGSAFREFADLPHTVGMISNLDRASALRALEAIKAENIRRQEFLVRKGFKDILRYHEEIFKLKHIPENWEPLPHLFIIIDEFAELAKEMQTFMSTLMSLLRVGRALGLHLILATQRPTGVITDEMRSNLNFRICLRVQSGDDSKDILRRPDAAMLPKDIPGRAIFQVGDAGVSHKFQTARVAVDYMVHTKEQESADPVYYLDREEETSMDVWEKEIEPTEPGEIEKDSYISNILINEMKHLYDQMMSGQKLKQMDKILLDPLKEELLFSEISPYISGGWNGKKWVTTSERQGFKVVVGVLDDLARRQQPPLWIEFQDKGNLLVLGSPSSGKTSFIRTMICSLAYQYSPLEVNIFVLSFAGKSLSALMGFPQVGDVIVGGQTEKLQRLISYLSNQLEIRKTILGIKGIDSLPEYNSQVNKPLERLPSIVVIVDNFGELKNTEYMFELEEIVKLIENGRNVGIYFVGTFLQFSDIPHKVLNLVEQRIAFNLTDKGDYKSFVGAMTSPEIGSLPPGRGFRFGLPPMQFQIATTISSQSIKEDESKSVGGLAAGIAADMLKMKQICPESESAPGILTLPTRINLFTLLGKSQEVAKMFTSSFPMGSDGNTLDTFNIDWEKCPSHLLIGGPSQSGRTSFLQSIVLSIANTLSPADASVLLVDGTQTSLRRLRNLPHVIEWVTDEDRLSLNLKYLIEELKKRRELMNTVSEENNPQLTTRLNHQIFIVIDDYDLIREVMPIQSDLLNVLSKHIRRDYDIKFHFIISCVSQSLSRDLDPLIKQIKSLRGGGSLVNHETLEHLGGKATATMRKQEFTEGRGYFINRTRMHMVQFAFPDDDSLKQSLSAWEGISKSHWSDDLVIPNADQNEANDVGPARDRASDKSSQSWFDNIDELEEQYIRLRRKEITENNAKTDRKDISA